MTLGVLRPTRAAVLAFGNKAPFRSSSASLITDQAQPLQELTGVQKTILENCHQARPLKELQAAVGIKHRPYFTANYLEPLLRAGLLEMLYPEQPKHPRQSYRTTLAGLRLLGSLS